MRGIWKSGIMIKSKAVTAGVSGGVDFTVLAREVGSLKMYDWKTFLAALLLGGAGMAIHLMKLLQGGMVSLAWLILFAYLICRGIYESVTEQGFRRGKGTEQSGEAGLPGTLWKAVACGELERGDWLGSDNYSGAGLCSCMDDCSRWDCGPALSAYSDGYHKGRFKKIQITAPSVGRVQDGVGYRFCVGDFTKC